MTRKDCHYCGNECTRDELQLCEIDGCGDIVCRECIKVHITRHLTDEEWDEI